MRILVAGMLAGDPGQGGATWAVLQYVIGLERLGHEVLAVEPVDALNLEVAGYFESLALPRAALLVRGGRETLGLSFDEVAAFNAELLLNISGMLDDDELTASIPTRVFVDLDPVFVQLWHIQGVDMGFDRHTHHVTVADRLPDAGTDRDRRWMPTLPPVVLDAWPVADSLARDAFTTVGNWRSYGSVHHNGAVYGQKAHATRRLLELPQLTPEPLLMALAIDPGDSADVASLSEHGWPLIDPSIVADTPDAYHRFVSGSRGELGLAKAGYIDSGCGWFSDRSACYLAAGRPVVAADTGFARRLPVGEGLLSYSSAVDAAFAMGRVASDYERHRAAARAIAEQHLDSDRVLTSLLEAVL